MAIKKKRSFYDTIQEYFNDMDKEIDRWHESMIEGPSWNHKTSTMEPLKDMRVTPTEVIVTVDLPLTKKTTLRVKPVDENILEISAQMRRKVTFKEMGIIVTSTCTPYLSGNLPRFREHIAWSESSAVSFSNSVIGARTNREGGPSALAAAICGKTPNYDLHLDENRHPHVKIKVDIDMEFSSDFGALGYFGGRPILDLAGLVSPEVIPFIRDEPAIENYLDDHRADFLVTFPGWYPYLTSQASLIFSTAGSFSPQLSGENMAVYRWRDR